MFCERSLFTSFIWTIQVFAFLLFLEHAWKNRRLHKITCYTLYKNCWTKLKCVCIAVKIILFHNIHQTMFSSMSAKELFIRCWGENMKRCIYQFLTNRFIFRFSSSEKHYTWRRRLRRFEKEFPAFSSTLEIKQVTFLFAAHKS